MSEVLGEQKLMAWICIALLSFLLWARFEDEEWLSKRASCRMKPPA